MYDVSRVRDYTRQNYCSQGGEVSPLNYKTVFGNHKYHESRESMIGLLAC